MFQRVARRDELSPGEVMAITVGDRRLALCNVEGEFYAVDDTCPHVGGPLSQGFLEGKALYCPWHAWPFDVASGASTEIHGVCVLRYPVRLEGDDVLVDSEPLPEGA